MKKFLTACLFLSMCLGCSATAFAAESQYPADEHSGEIFITVNSAEELAAFEAELKENNARAQKLWEQAVQESYLPENQMTDSTPIVPYAETVYENSVTRLKGNGSPYTITFKAFYTKSKKNYGVPIISSVKDITAHVPDKDHKLSVMSKDYKRIDSLRTLAAHYNCRISVYSQSDGAFFDFSGEYYVEFYVNGSAKIY